jgi:hypothetical protein
VGAGREGGAALLPPPLEVGFHDDLQLGVGHLGGAKAAPAPLVPLGSRAQVEDVGQAPLLDETGDVVVREGVEGVGAQQDTGAGDAGPSREAAEIAHVVGAIEIDPAVDEGSGHAGQCGGPR